jgi:peptidoglycan/LPS O-acetylase OafA/YrhL
MARGAPAARGGEPLTAPPPTGHPPSGHPSPGYPSTGWPGFPTYQDESAGYPDGYATDGAGAGAGFAAPAAGPWFAGPTLDPGFPVAAPGPGFAYHTTGPGFPALDPGFADHTPRRIQPTRTPPRRSIRFRRPARPRSDRRSDRRPARNFRADIEGLRGLAVLLVVLWHAGLPGLPGGFVGVDVFFVISGYLITGLITAEIRARGRLSLTTFYARRARRLLPSAALVLCAVAVAGYLLLPPIRWRDTAWDVVASALYLVNWRFAERSVDYLAATQAPSIVQHFWSLAVEEQFYLVWPLLLVAVAVAVRRRPDRRAFRPIALRVVAALAVGSFAWSVVQTMVEPARAYFVTTTRIWELALGALLALARFPVRPSAALAAGLGWTGMAAIAGSALVLDVTTPFPGAAALPVTVGTALVIATTEVAGRHGPIGLLRVRALQAVGRISYPLYLWHWPLLVLATARLGELSWPVALAVVALSFVPAYLTSRLLEQPVRHARIFAADRQAALHLGLACMIASLMAGLALRVTAAPASELIGTAGPVTGANAIRDGDPPGGTLVDRVTGITPDPLAARGDLPDVDRDGCHLDPRESALHTCVYGSGDAGFTVALVGDSHAAQWVPALQQIAQQRGWRLTVDTKSQCPVLDTPVADASRRRPEPSCATWTTALREKLRRERPGLIVVANYDYQAVRNGTVLTGADNSIALIASMRRTWGELAADTRLVVLRDTPAPQIDVAECVSVHREQLTRCAVDRATALAGIGTVQAAAAAGLDRVRLVDLNDAICPDTRCAPVIGGVLVYRDTNHLTATYARTLAPRLDERLQAALR